MPTRESALSLTAVILAGGLSRRMGKPKALLWVDGTSLIERTRSILKELSPVVERVLISGRVPGIKSIADRIAFQGPVGGIFSTAQHCFTDGERSRGLLVVPVDLPRLTSESLRPMLDHFLQHPTRAVCYGTSWLPAVFPLSDSLLTHSETSRSVHELLNHVGFVSLASPVDPQALSNANTPEEWALLTGSPP